MLNRNNPRKGTISAFCLDGSVMSKAECWNALAFSLPWEIPSKQNAIACTCLCTSFYFFERIKGIFYFHTWVAILTCFCTDIVPFLGLLIKHCSADSLRCLAPRGRRGEPPHIHCLVFVFSKQKQWIVTSYQPSKNIVSGSYLSF